MAKNDNIIDFLGDVADAIREKKETTDPINAQDFADEIKGIKTDGMRYFDVRGFFNVDYMPAASLAKAYTGNFWIVGTSLMVIQSGLSGYVGAIAVDDRKISSKSGDDLISIFDFAKSNNLDIEATFPEITKEEFYDLTWEAPEVEQPI